MGRKQKERQKKKNNQKMLATATTATASSGDAVGGNNSATAGRSNRVDGVDCVDVDVDVDDDVGVGVAAAMERITMATCYHGSTAGNFAKGSNFQMALDEWHTMCVHLAGKNPREVGIGLSNFYAKHEKLMNNPEFDQCVFAAGTDIFLNSYGSEEYSSSKQMLQTVLNLGISSKYMHPLSADADREKCEKYNRDIMTNRGIINVLDRETNNFCNCMTPYKEEAKVMKKMGSCLNCHHEFPKLFLKRCSRCLCVQYCSKECMKNNWPTHKQFCKPHNNKSEE